MSWKLPIENDPARKGELAAEKRLFKGNRYAVAPVHTRYDKVAWFVWDAEMPGEGYDPVLGWSPAVVRICDSYEEAVAGLT